MTSGKHLIEDDTRDLVINSLRGLARCNPRLVLDPKHRIVYAKPDAARVHLLSGGGSGHEPGSAGFVGSNMLDCAVCGDVFASPSAAAVTSGIKVMGDNPVLVIVLNYTGDRLHFGIAIENANRSGQQADMVVVADDVSVGRTQGGRVGRRGLAGIVLVHKVAGGSAAAGHTLEQVKADAMEVANNTVTVGASLSHASVPGSSGEEVELKHDEIEIGMGIHNEPGFEKIKTPKVSDLARLLLKQLLDQQDQERAFVPFSSGDEVLLLINNLGAISALELYHLTQVVGQQLETDWHLKIVRTLTGSFVTSLDGAGASITLLNLSNLKNKGDILGYLDRPTDAPGWNSMVQAENWSSSSEEVSASSIAKPKSSVTIAVKSEEARRLIAGACQSLIASEAEITKYDTIAGDGDAGQTLKSAAEAVLAALASGEVSTTNLVDLFGDIAAVLEDKMGGTGGALYTIYFSALSASLIADKGKTIDSALMAATVANALDRLQTYTTATIGDKTMMDALIPFSRTFSSSKSFSMAVEAAEKGAVSTKGMTAGLGRATYIDKSATATVPDAGAVGIWRLLQGINQMRS